MISNYLKIALRNLLKKKVFSIINIWGLALGMAACLSIFYYVQYELSYDEFITDSDEVYRMYFARDMEAQTRVYFQPGTALKPTLDQIPEIESSFRLVQVDYQNYSLIRDNHGQRTTIEQTGVQYADGDIGETLDLSLAEGSFNAMDEPYKMVLSEKVANKLFSSAKAAIGETITLSGNIGKFDYQVVGVTEDLPGNSQFNLSVLLSFASLQAIEGREGYDAANDWNSWNTQTYFRSTKSQADLLNVLKRNVTDLDVFQSDETTWHARLLPLTELHLTEIKADDTLDQSAKNLIYGLGVIGLFILGIAWINFINLSTARAMERAREVGVRKALGSHINQIRVQFMVESLLINALAAVLALTMVQLALPKIFTISDVMTLPEGSAPLFWTVFVGVLLSGTFLSGLYPAFVLSAFKTTVVLKGRLASQQRGEVLRKSLVVFQFAASAFMIIGTFITYYQISYMQNKDLGLAIDNVLILEAPPGNIHGDTDFYKAVNAFKEEVQQLNSVKHMAASSDVPGAPTGWGTSFYKTNETIEDRKHVNLLAVDSDFASAYDIKLAAGRFYQPADGTFDKGNLVINESAAELLGFETPEDAVGKNLVEGRMFPELTIIGVVKDFHHQSLKVKIEPLAFVKSSWSTYYSLSLNISDDLTSARKAELLKSTVSEVKDVWAKFFPEQPFDYTFLDQRFAAQYKSDQEFSFIITLFAVLSVIIACLGLLGLASYSVSQRTKEIGIRKVLGASVSKIFHLLSVEYVLLMVVASLIAIPLAYYVVELWLGEYAYKIELQWWMFGLPVLGILLIAMFTVGTQVFNATRKNPVDSLRYE